VETDATTAELAKLFENTYRDVNIALANQMAEIAEGHGVDATEALELASLHPRVDLLSPGIGVGGRCIPIDPWFLHLASQQGASLIAAARTINDMRPDRAASRIATELDGIDRPRVVLAGAAYKTNVSDTRNSPAMQVARILAERGFDVIVYDGFVEEYASDLKEDARGADLIAVLVPHAKMMERLATERHMIEAGTRRPRIVDFSTGSPRPL